jgi:hypothetical protein
MGLMKDSKVRIQRHHDWVWVAKTKNVNTSARAMPVCALNKQTYTRLRAQANFVPSEWDDKCGPYWMGNPSPYRVQKEREKQQEKLGPKQPIIELSGMNIAPAEEYWSSGEEMEEEARMTKDTPFKPTGKQWLHVEAAQAFGSKSSEGAVYKRIQLLEYQIGERALADISYETYDISSFKGKLTAAKWTIFMNDVDYGAFINFVTAYQEKAKDCLDYYDSLFDPRLSVAE